MPRLATIILCASSLAAAGCRGREAPRAYVVDDSVKVGADGRLLTLEPLEGYLRANPAWEGQAITLPGVLPSIRLKQVRRGLQDYEYLWLARQRGAGARADFARAIAAGGP